MPSFATKSSKSKPLHVIDPDGLKSFLKSKPAAVRAWIKANDFKAHHGDVLAIPDAKGNITSYLVGWSTTARERFGFSPVMAQLPKGSYHIASGMGKEARKQSAYAALLSTYAFNRYAPQSAGKAKLQCPDQDSKAQLLAMAEGEFLARDLINTPTSDMGPDALEKAFRDLAKKHSAKVKVIKGDALLKQNFPLIHTVGRASDQAPRLLDLRWGKASHPKVTLVGKGVCFDTGGLNIKPASSMALMKKDMGGATTTMGLAHMIMALGLKVQLRLLVPAVENSISAGAYRPGDILTSRKGLTVEINNTDAEGRLVLADALALADEERPDLMICKATLTGAARVALGPDLPPYYTDDDKLAKQIDKGSNAAWDPLWRMPFYEPYETMVEPGIADLDNAPRGGFAGSITAALFLRRFVQKAKSFVHLDVYGWTPSSKPGRPQGGACQSARAMLMMLQERYG
ncbi:MAG: leucyl aminopeptidase family protein [Pseudomonadota bacterium]